MTLGLAASLVVSGENEPVDAAQIAVAFGVVQPPADDEIRRNLKPDIADRQVEGSGGRFAQQGAEPEAGRSAPLQRVDTGRTVTAVIDALQRRGPAGVE